MFIYVRRFVCIRCEEVLTDAVFPRPCFAPASSYAFVDEGIGAEAVVLLSQSAFDTKNGRRNEVSWA